MDSYTLSEQAYKNGYEAGKPKWNSVDERLPEDGEVVLCKTKWIYEVLQWCSRINTWLGKDRAYSASHVTHWMPIPELPEV